MGKMMSSKHGEVIGTFRFSKEKKLLKLFLKNTLQNPADPRAWKGLLYEFRVKSQRIVSKRPRQNALAEWQYVLQCTYKHYQSAS
jgi:hypothetical protein